MIPGNFQGLSFSDGHIPFAHHGASCSQQTNSINGIAAGEDLPQYSVDVASFSVPQWISQESAPMGRLVRLHNAGLIDERGQGRHLQWPFVIPALTPQCRKDLWFALARVQQIQLKQKSFLVSPLAWFCRLMKLSTEANLQYWDTYLTGSAVPVSQSWWGALVSNWKINDSSLRAEVLDSFQASGQSWSNLDSLIRVHVSNATERDHFEQLVLQALAELSKGQMSSSEVKAAVTGPIRLGDVGTLITIGNTELSFDLMIWYVDDNKELPQLFTQQGLNLRIHHLLSSPMDQWPDIYPSFTGVSPEQWMVDRCLGILRFSQPGSRRKYWDAGLLKKTLVMKTKGAPSFQTGLESFCFSIFKDLRTSPDEFLCEGQQSFRDHLPKDPAAALAFCLHWMDLVESQWNAAGAAQDPHLDKVKREYWCALAKLCPCPGKLPNSLQGIAAFVQSMPEQMDVFFALFDSALLGLYVERAAGAANSGEGPELLPQLWQGHLHLGLRLGAKEPSTFIRPFDPLGCLQTLAAIREKSATDKATREAFYKSEKAIEGFILLFPSTAPTEMEAAALQQLKVLGLSGSLVHSSILALEDRNSPTLSWLNTQLARLKASFYPAEVSYPPAAALTTAIQVCQQVEAPNTESSLSSSSSSEAPKKQPKLIRLLDNGQWLKAARYLLKLKGRSAEGCDSVRAGRHIWTLLQGFQVLWRRFPSSKIERSVIGQLIPAYATALEKARAQCKLPRSQAGSHAVFSVLSGGYNVGQKCRWLLEVGDVLRKVLSADELLQLLIDVIDQLPVEQEEDVLKIAAAYPELCSIASLRIERYSHLAQLMIKSGQQDRVLEEVVRWLAAVRQSSIPITFQESVLYGARAPCLDDRKLVRIPNTGPFEIDPSTGALALYKIRFLNRDRYASDVDHLLGLIQSIPAEELPHAVVQEISDLAQRSANESRWSELSQLWPLLEKWDAENLLPSAQLSSLCAQRAKQALQEKNLQHLLFTLRQWVYLDPSDKERRIPMLQELFNRALNSCQLPTAKVAIELLKQDSGEEPSRERTAYLRASQSISSTNNALEDLFTHWNTIDAQVRNKLLRELATDQRVQNRRKRYIEPRHLKRMWRELKKEIKDETPLTPKDWRAVLDKLATSATYGQCWDAIMSCPVLGEILDRDVKQLIESILSSTVDPNLQEGIWKKRRVHLIPTINKLQDHLDLSKELRKGRGLTARVLKNLMILVKDANNIQVSHREVWNFTNDLVQDIAAKIPSSDRKSQLFIKEMRSDIDAVARAQGYGKWEHWEFLVHLLKSAPAIILTRVVLFNIGILFFGLLFRRLPPQMSLISEFGDQWVESHYL